MSDYKGGLVLLVDDEPELLSVISEELGSAGFRFICAKDGLEALQLVKSARPDAVLSDINMPNMNGLELVHEVRKLGIEIPFVLLTAHYNPENIVKALRLGVADFLEKPFKLKHLLNVMSNAVQLGFEIKRLDAQIDELCAKNNMTPEQRQGFRRQKLAMAIMQSTPSTTFSKAG